MATQKEIMAAKGYMTPREVAKKIGQSLATVHRKIEMKKVKAEKVGDLWYIEVRSLIEHLGPKAELFGFVPLPPEE